MLEHVPAWLGRALQNVRAGADKLCIFQPELGNGFHELSISSMAFSHGGRLPERFTADGEGVSPPLHWSEAPPGTVRFALLVEDADAPAPAPLVHALIWGMPAHDTSLEEGAIKPDGDGEPDGTDVGRNSFFREGWLPPDPPSGHGDHHYAFQIFALSDGPDPGATPGRAALVEAMAGRVLGAGLLVATYSREEPADIGPVGDAALI